MTDPDIDCGVFTVFFSTHSLARLYPMQLVVVMLVMSAVRMVMMMSTMRLMVRFELSVIVN